MSVKMEHINLLLHLIYDDVLDDETQWKNLLEKYCKKWTTQTTSTNADISIFDESLALVITYGDSLKKEGERPIQTLHNFLLDFAPGLITGVHILPYFPYTSDDGFSISDYRNVRPDLGTWDDVHELSKNFVLMSDLVLNHCSSKHKWFQKFLECEKPYDTFFTTGDKDADYSSVVRPRPHFILNTFNTKQGPKHVWTTFSRDQVDLNFKDPLVLFEMLDIMMDYVQVHNSPIIRLDAIAYLWKELGTPCLHHKKTHAVVQLMRAVLDEFTKQSIIITETNVPHKENIQYFGKENEPPEAHMIYQFPLPPLLLHAFMKEDTSYFTKWLQNLDQPQENKTYFNFCASHDGIGVTPTHGILPENERQFLIDTAKKRGAKISYKATPEGEIPYEINVNYFSAIADESLPIEQRAKIFLASQSILLSMPGVPALYIHSLLGSENWLEGVEQTNINRSINREKLDIEKISTQLANSNSGRSKIFNGILQLLSARKKSKAFHPFSPCCCVDTSDGADTAHKTIAFIRGDNKTLEEGARVLCLVNITSEPVTQQLDSNLFSWKEGCKDLFTNDVVFVPQVKNVAGKQCVELSLEPYEIMWLEETK